MELVDGLINFLRGSTAKVEPKSQPSSEKVIEPNSKYWDSNQFRSYLLGIARGGEFMLPIYRYPERIQLSKGWHTTLNDLGKIGQSMVEGNNIIGVDETRQTIVMATAPGIGKSNHVPASVEREQRLRASYKRGITKFLGSLHSHPAKVYWQYGSMKGKFTDVEANLSVADLFFLVKKDPEEIMGVVEGEENMIAMRTRGSDTSLSYIGIENPRQEDFSRYWHNKFGNSLELDKEGIGIVSNIDKTRNARKLDREIVKAIAERHALVIYTGKKDSDLQRVFP